MVLKQHTIYEKPHSEEILMLVELQGDKTDRYLWTVGSWEEKGWTCVFDDMGYNVIEWYELPPRPRIEKEYSYKQMTLEDFWNNK